MIDDQFYAGGYMFIRHQEDEFEWPIWHVIGRGGKYVGLISQPPEFQDTECIALGHGGPVMYSEFPGVPAIFASPERAARSIEEDNVVHLLRAQ